MSSMDGRRPGKTEGPRLGADMQVLLERWTDLGWLRLLDSALARFLLTEVPDASPWLLLAAALASHQLGRGHACLDLAATLEDPNFALSLPPEGYGGQDVPADIPTPRELMGGLGLSPWLAALEHPELVGRGAGHTPLVLAAPRLYLRRFWQYEQDVRAGIGDRLARSAAAQERCSPAGLRPILDILFPKGSAGPARADWQKLACALAARNSFAIITGGPGTGKTTTVLRLMALLQALALGGSGPEGGEARPLRIRLSAPTGKAAARLNESLAKAVGELPLEGLERPELIRSSIPVAVSTLHRLLGSRPDSRSFRRRADHPLPVDVLVIDEASMIDLELMAAVLDALPPSARLILLGDKDQLASVEAGAVLGELCDHARRGRYTRSTAAWLEAASGQPVGAEFMDEGGTPLDQAVAMLRHSHRFPAESGIGRLAEGINGGDFRALRGLLGESFPDFAYVSGPAADEEALRRLCVDGWPAAGEQGGKVPMGYRHYLETVRHGRPGPGAGRQAFDDWAREVLKAHGSFQVLCALRRGPWGVEGLNRRIEAWLRAVELISGEGDWYLGRPVLVTRNEYSLGLMNGDMGISLALPDREGPEWVSRVAFPAGDGGQGIKWVLPSRLSAVETVYGLTVHKSQGSEFDHVALVLPETLSPILTRELLYTGATRPRKFLTLVNPGGEGLLAQAVGRRVLRASGLLAEGGMV